MMTMRESRRKWIELPIIIEEEDLEADLALAWSLLHRGKRATEQARTPEAHKEMPHDFRLSLIEMMVSWTKKVIRVYLMPAHP